MSTPNNYPVPLSKASRLPVVVTPSATPDLESCPPALSRGRRPITEADPQQLLDLRQRLLSACDLGDLSAIVRERELVSRMRPSSRWSEQDWINVCLSIAIVDAVCPGTLSKQTADTIWAGFHAASTHGEEVQGKGAAAALALGTAGRTHGVARSAIVQEILCARREYLIPSLLLGLYLTAGLSEGPVRNGVGHFLVDLAVENRKLRKKASLPVGRDGPQSSVTALVVADHGLKRLFPKVSSSLWNDSDDYRYNLTRAARELIRFDPDLSSRLDQSLTRHLTRRNSGAAQLPVGSASPRPDSRPKRVADRDASRALVPAGTSELPASVEPSAASLLSFLAAQAREILRFADKGYRAADKLWREQREAWIRENSW